MRAGNRNSWIDEQARDDGRPGETPAPEVVDQPRSHEGDALEDGVDHPDAGAGEQVVGQRVAGETFQDDDHPQRQTDDPVDLPGLAEGAGEEDPAEVEQDGGHEDERGPVVGLAHDQPEAHVEGDVDDGLVGLAHVLAVQGSVDVPAGRGVDHVGAGWHVEEGQVDAGGDQDDERVHGDLAHHERPVVREDLVQDAGEELGRTEALVDGVEGRLAEAVALPGGGPLLGGAHLLTRDSRTRGLPARCSRSGTRGNRHCRP